MVDRVADDILVRADKNYRRDGSAIVIKRRLRMNENGVEPKTKKRQRFVGFFLLFVRRIIPQPCHVEDHHVNAKSADKQMVQRVKNVLSCMIEQRQLDGLAVFRVPGHTVKQEKARNGSEQT